MERILSAILFLYSVNHWLSCFEKVFYERYDESINRLTGLDTLTSAAACPPLSVLSSTPPR
jgi:hypothetical protein